MIERTRAEAAMVGKKSRSLNEEVENFLKVANLAKKKTYRNNQQLIAVEEVVSGKF